MGLLQDPQKAIRQVRWYLDHQDLQQFPGAFELAAGNLCRQTLEQILFILCFFSGMPSTNYVRRDRTLKTAGQMLVALQRTDLNTGLAYMALARRRGSRIRKFARHPSSLKKWQHELNEPSHYSAQFRRVDEAWLRTFVSRIDGYFDGRDAFLLVAAANELFSQGRVTATLGKEPDNIPGIMTKSVITPRHIVKTGSGGLAIEGPQGPVEVLSDTTIPRGRWPRKPVLVQHTAGISIGIQLVTKRGDPLDIRSMEATLGSLAKTSGQRAALTRRLRQLGFDIEWGKPAAPPTS